MSVSQYGMDARPQSADSVGCFAMAPRPDCPLTHPRQAELDGLLRLGIEVMSLAKPVAMQIATGHRAADGRLNPDIAGARWLAFEEPGAGDIVFWHQVSGRLATWCGRSFALGEDAIDEAATYSFDCALNIYDDPLDWLRSRRDGIVVLPPMWPIAFDRLRYCSRITLPASVLPIYQRWMQPSRMPEVFVVPQRRRAA